MTHVKILGTTAVLTMRRQFVKISVFVMAATRRALVDMGEQRSPKYEPAMMAPPEYIGGIFMLLAIVMQITPMVAAVPKDVPVRADTRAHSRNDARRTALPSHYCEAWYTIYGIVPLMRQAAVSMPTRDRVMRTFFVVLMPDKAR